MIITVFVLLASALLIFFSCELFVNSVEWFGKRFNVAKSAVGSILAAFGTALPESVVTLTAVVFGTNTDQKDIGVGAAIGGPLVLSTVAYAVVGLSIFFYHKRRAQGTDLLIDSRKLTRDQLWFMSIFVLSFLLGYTSYPGKQWIGLLLFASYGLYFFLEMRATDNEQHEDKEELEPLRFRPNSSNPESLWIIIQTLTSLTLIFIGSHYFVGRLETISLSLGLSPHVVALLLSPLATELPEVVNVLIWVRQGKEELSLANISGAMMIQTTIPSGLGILFTPWLFDNYLKLAAVMTIFSIGFIWFMLRNNRLSSGRLTFAVTFYLIFAIGFVIGNGRLNS
ncbi:sodium:calcium antiporter [Heliobacillus mobilis]|uniref:Sodium:calcium antiporter n=1 Tax=Heliobacterium mobile TaxID=28064 RepID=A0A6I3SI49_HELMO|nr:sodium:calcium antiporter [Heliobacterium mobile]MTV48541.1 sodium:calcium antiporter [Heliobacterium mobile]